MISLLSLLVFAVPEEDLADKISIVLTLLLTSVAFKFVIGDKLPRVNYTHFMDAFVSNNMLFLFSVAVLTTVDSLFYRFSETLDHDLHEFSNMNISMLLGALVLLFFINGRWVLSVRKVYHPNSHRTPLINMIEGKNWYNCQYGNPFFMEQPRKNTEPVWTCISD
jgi:hypothetical protein